jgi:hypothetical protein
VPLLLVGPPACPVLPAVVCPPPVVDPATIEPALEQAAMREYTTHPENRASITLLVSAM